MSKFFIDGRGVTYGTAVITGGDVNHMRNVLRLGPGDAVTATDPVSGTDYLCEISRLDNFHAELKIISSGPSGREPDYKTTMFLALLKGDRFDLAIQKCVELGAHAIVPVTTERTVAGLGADKSSVKTERRNRIAESAAKQCMRGVVPRVSDAVTLDKAVEMSRGMGIRFAAYEKETNARIRDVVGGAPDRGNKTAAIFIGPEGGFTDGEARMMSDGGVKTASLGSRVLRAETAAFTALIIFLYETGDF